jgi:hypothetical protein
VAIWEDSHWHLVTKDVRAGTVIRLHSVQDSRMEKGLRYFKLGDPTIVIRRGIIGVSITAVTTTVVVVV